MKLTHSTPIKVIAIILLVLSLAVTVGGTVGAILFYEWDFYAQDAPEDFFESDWCDSLATRLTYDHIYWQYIDQLPLWSSQNIGKIENVGNLYFEIYNRTPLPVGSNKEEGVEYAYEGEVLFYSESPSGYGADYTVKTYVRADLFYKDDFYYASMLYDTVFPMRYINFALIAGAALVSILLFVFLMCAAGKRKGFDEPILSWLDRIPLDLLTVLYFGIIMLSFAFFNEIMWHAGDLVQALGVIAFALVIFLFFLSFCMSFAARAKCGTLWRNTLVYIVVSLVFGVAKRIFTHLNVIWKSAMIFGVICFAELLVVSTGENDIILLFWFFGNLIIFACLCLASIGFNETRKSAKKLARGELDRKTETKYMFGDIKEHAQDLNSIGDGMARAVEEKMKSERFKTELITNVSHDIKTPLTSIVNYVDLLKKEEIENDTAREYIEVLDRQSMRLKKLTEDLVEASKASTGNIAVDAAKLNVCELLLQSVAEYNEKLESSSLEPIIKMPETDVFIFADGRLLWRVFDNLLANICKYSQSGTRIYLDILKDGGKVVITFKNISRYPLNISAEELLGRFVRGDESRTTEGSGLGLSIANSLCELQGGKFSIFVDGDLFKASLSFNEAE